MYVPPSLQPYTIPTSLADLENTHSALETGQPRQPTFSIGRSTSAAGTFRLSSGRISLSRI
jgi:hypothetical protein